MLLHGRHEPTDRRPKRTLIVGFEHLLEKIEIEERET